MNDEGNREFEQQSNDNQPIGPEERSGARRNVVGSSRARFAGNHDDESSDLCLKKFVKFNVGSRGRFAGNRDEDSIGDDDKCRNCQRKERSDNKRRHWSASSSSSGKSMIRRSGGQASSRESEGIGYYSTPSVNSQEPQIPMEIDPGYQEKKEGEEENEYDSEFYDLKLQEYIEANEQAGEANAFDNPNFEFYEDDDFELPKDPRETSQHEYESEDGECEYEEEDESFEKTPCDSRPGKNPMLFIRHGRYQSFLKNPKRGEFRSPDSGWKRAIEKYSPSKDIYHSPVKQCDANLNPTTVYDIYLSGCAWILSMSEQFYYDNSLVLIHKYFDDNESLINALRFNSQVMDLEYFASRLVEVTGLGSGAFGDVYRVKNAETNEYFVIKHLKNTPSESFTQHTRTILDYIKERNSLIRAQASPYVVQFNFSIKFPEISGLFLFFEWCLCDLRKYINIINYWKKKDITEALWNGIVEAIDNIFIYVYGPIEEDLFMTTLVYIFEVFCVIDFLAQCNIVHQDLKPENIMISTNLHLKVGDFGLSYNTQFVTRDSQVRLVHRNQISNYESTNYAPKGGGTPTYQDMELCYRHLKRANYGEEIPEIIYQSDVIDTELITNTKEADPDFLSDIWACGIIATELLLAGTHIFNPRHMPQGLLFAASITDDFEAAVLSVTYRKSIYEKYIKTGFLNFGGEDFSDLMTFLASIFTPRQVRCEDYVKEKYVLRLKHTVSVKHIDIKKVEQISVFQNIGLESSNSFLYEMPRGLFKYLYDEKPPLYGQLWDLLNAIAATSGKDEFFPLEPGIQASYF